MKMVFGVSLLCFLSYPLVSLGQKENLEWIFNDSGRGFQFDSITNNITITSGNYTPYTREGCSVVSNPLTGELLFYTDGVRVVNSKHTVMPNGNNLFGDISSSQSGLVCVKPGSCNQYYVFYNDRVAHEFTGGSLYYSIIDMSLPGSGSAANPLGDVVPNQKNKFISGNSSEAMMLIPDKDNSRFWLLSPQINSDLIHIYLIDQAGIRLHNTFSSGFQLFAARSIRFSEVRSKIVLVSTFENEVALLIDFNSSQGMLSNPKIVPGTPLDVNSNHITGMFDAEWSADGSKVYFSRFRVGEVSAGQLFQYDLNNPLEPLVLIHSLGNSPFNHSSGLKRGRDNKIYHLYINSVHFDKRIIGVINEPNKKGIACNYNPSGVNLGGSISGAHKFPEFLFFSNLDFLNTGKLDMPDWTDVVLCDDEILLLDAGNDGASYLWSDGSTARTLTVSKAGSYSVTISKQCESIKKSVKISYRSPPIFDLGKDTILCKGQVLELKILSDESSSILWSNGSRESEISITKSGEYSATVENFCGKYEDRINVLVRGLEPNPLIPNVITSNGDGFNDYFILNSDLRDSKIEIINRWGRSVFYSENYQNNWNGSGLSAGIYFYLISNGCADRRLKGSIQLIK